MKLQKVINHLENMIDSIETQLHSKTDRIFTPNGVDHKQLVDEVFQWNFGSISKLVEERECYNLFLRTLKNADWEDTSGSKMSIDQWWDNKIDTYKKLAMRTPPRGSNQANNLLESYKREARKEVYEWLLMIKENHGGVEIDS